MDVVGASRMAGAHLFGASNPSHRRLTMPDAVRRSYTCRFCPDPHTTTSWREYTAHRDAYRAKHGDDDA